MGGKQMYEDREQYLIIVGKGKKPIVTDFDPKKLSIVIKNFQKQKETLAGTIKQQKELIQELNDDIKRLQREKRKFPARDYMGDPL